MHSVWGNNKQELWHGYLVALGRANTFHFIGNLTGGKGLGTLQRCQLSGTGLGDCGRCKTRSIDYFVKGGLSHCSLSLQESVEQKVSTWDFGARLRGASWLGRHTFHVGSVWHTDQSIGLQKVPMSWGTPQSMAHLARDERWKGCQCTHRAQPFVVRSFWWTAHSPVSG